MDNPQFLTPEALAKKYRSAFTLSSLRWHLFNRESNGLDSAVIQLGRKLLIDEAAFVVWLRSQRGAHKPRAAA